MRASEDWCFKPTDDPETSFPCRPAYNHFQAEIKRVLTYVVPPRGTCTRVLSSSVPPVPDAKELAPLNYEESFSLCLLPKATPLLFLSTNPRR